MDLSAVKDALDFFSDLVDNILGLFERIPFLFKHIGELAADKYVPADATAEEKKALVEGQTYFNFDAIFPPETTAPAAPEEPKQ